MVLPSQSGSSPFSETFLETPLETGPGVCLHRVSKSVTQSLSQSVFRSVSCCHFLTPMSWGELWTLDSTQPICSIIFCFYLWQGLKAFPGSYHRTMNQSPREVSQGPCSPWAGPLLVLCLPWGRTSEGNNILLDICLQKPRTKQCFLDLWFYLRPLVLNVEFLRA